MSLNSCRLTVGLTARLAPIAIALTIVANRFCLIALFSAPTATSPPVKNNCSMTNGTPRTAVNGQPMMAPTAKQRVARVARDVPVGVVVAGWNQNDEASMVVYMAKLDGRKAVISSGSDPQRSAHRY